MLVLADLRHMPDRHHCALPRPTILRVAPDFLSLLLRVDCERLGA